jgi:tryptophan synthase alpha chain
MNKVRATLDQLKRQKKTAFVPYVTYGYPDRATFKKIVCALDESGVDIIEVGMPFSDPIADGPVIQKSSQVALKHGATLKGLLADLKELKKTVKTPFALMTYFNPVLYMGVEAFARAASGIVDALVIPDLLPEESGEMVKACRKNKIDTVSFIAPTTDENRFALIDKHTTGFVYYVSVTGTTGTRASFDKDIFKKIARARKKIKAPLIVGFGISTPEHVRTFGRVADGVIVGSALVRVIMENPKNPVPAVKSVVKKLMGNNRSLLQG